MRSLSGIITSLSKSLSGWIGDPSQFKEKKWIAYGFFLLIGIVLFISVGGSRGRYSDTSLGQDSNAGEAFNKMSAKLGDLGGGVGVANRQGLSAKEAVPVYDTWGRDPFAIPRKGKNAATRHKEKQDLHLSAISWRGDKAFVLINDTVLSKGDRIAGAEVLEIYQTSVVLRRGGRWIVLDLNGDG